MSDDQRFLRARMRHGNHDRSRRLAESRRPHPVEVYPHSVRPNAGQMRRLLPLASSTGCTDRVDVVISFRLFFSIFYYSLSADTDTVIAKSPGDRADAEHFKRDFRRIVCLHEIRSVPEPQLMNRLYLKVRVIA